MEDSGVVESVGMDIMRFQPGDVVFGIGEGTFAEYAQAPESKLAMKPANVAFQQAAVIAISGLTALQALRTRGSYSRATYSARRSCLRIR